MHSTYLSNVARAVKSGVFVPSENPLYDGYVMDSPSRSVLLEWLSERLSNGDGTWQLPDGNSTKSLKKAIAEWSNVGIR